MQRIYDMPKKKPQQFAEFFELKDQEQPQQEMKPPTYKIPSSSNLINKAYRPVSQSYSSSHEEDTLKPQSHQQTPYISPRSLHCIVIADHIMDCPICCRLYRNYTPFYNIIIMILLIILIFLFIRCQKLALLLPKPATY